MPLPFILGAAAALIGTGAKKAYDGYQDKSEAEDILERVKREYKASKSIFDEKSETVEKALEKLGTLQLDIGKDFNDFHRLAEKLISQLEENQKRTIPLNIPKHQINKIETIALSATDYLGTLAVGGIAGAASAYAVYGGVMALAAASTGIKISALSGVAAYNATMAAIGGGSLAAGGFGMAGGAAILGGVVAAPIIAVAGWAYASHGKKALENAYEASEQADEAISKMEQGGLRLDETTEYVEKIHDLLALKYEIFKEYLATLININNVLETKGKSALNEYSDEVMNTVGNGYALAAILADVITTPLFKAKKDEQGNIKLGENDVPEFETDFSGMRLVNDDEIDAVLNKAR